MSRRPKHVTSIATLSTEMDVAPKAYEDDDFVGCAKNIRCNLQQGYRRAERLPKWETVLESIVRDIVCK